MEEKVIGVVVNVIFKNDDTGYAVIELETSDNVITAVGDIAGVSEGEELELIGAYVTHPNFGTQFKVQFCEYKLPETKGAILRYLSSGALPGIGPATARRIVDLYGENSLEIIAVQPEKLARLKGLSASKAQLISEAFKKIFGVREAITYFTKLGVNASTALAAYKHFGANTIDIISDNIYVLAGYPIYLPFEQVDAVAAEQAVEHESLLRIEAGLVYILRHNLQNGHTCLPKEKLLSAAENFLRVAPMLLENALENLFEKNELLLEAFETAELVFLPDLYRAEQYIAFTLNRLHNIQNEEQVSLNELEAVAKKQGITFAPLQQQAIKMAVEHSCFVLTGGPGTGKTTAVKSMIQLFEQRGDRVFLAAPTGRAAKRLTELSGKEAKTIHRLLEVAYNSGETPKFLHDESNPLRCDVVIIDEMSMVDVFIFEALLHALKPHCKVIMVGDADQLPSVGAGNILKDVISSKKVETVCLTEIFRQAEKSLIVVNAHHIVHGEMPKQGTAQDDFFFMEASGVQCRDLVIDLITKRLPTKYGLSPFEDIQVLCPSRLGAVGTTQLNIDLQARLNPATAGKKQTQIMGQVFREGDKVMQVRNNYDIAYEREDGFQGVGAFNGDIGVLEKVNNRTGVVQVRFEDRVYHYSAEQMRELEIAYAVTIHKSQGSEFEAVIIPISETPPKLCYRNLLYTGVTRAKKLLVMPGSAKLIGKMINNNKKTLRYSGLGKILKDDQFI